MLINLLTTSDRASTAGYQWVVGVKGRAPPFLKARRQHELLVEDLEVPLQIQSGGFGAH